MRPGETSIYEFLEKNLENANLTYKGETNFYVKQQPHYK